VSSRWHADEHWQESVSGVYPLESLNWLWPAANLNRLPPEPLRGDQTPFLIAWPAAVSVMCAAACGYGGLTPSCSDSSARPRCWCWHRCGIFLSDYELFRALAVLFFVPLGALFALPNRVASAFHNRRFERSPLRSQWSLPQPCCCASLRTTDTVRAGLWIAPTRCGVQHRRSSRPSRRGAHVRPEGHRLVQ